MGKKKKKTIKPKTKKQTKKPLRSPQLPKIQEEIEKLPSICGAFIFKADGIFKNTLFLHWLIL